MQGTTTGPFRPSPFVYDRRLGKVRLFVKEHLEGDISLETADVAGLERHYFSRHFYRAVGVHFREWLHGVRVRSAAKILSKHDESVLDVAYSVGYRDIRTFQRAFKGYFGVTPREYKLGKRPLPPGGQLRFD